jgi:hypothetical protein
MPQIDKIELVGDAFYMACPSYEEAGKSIAKESPDKYLTIVKPFMPSVLGCLVEVDGQQSIRLVGEQRAGVVPRHMHGLQEGVTASTLSSLEIDLVAHVEPRDSELLDRGLAWVAVGAEAKPLFKMGILPHSGATASEITERLIIAEFRAVEMINGVLNSDPLAPYSQKYSAAA